MQIRETPNPERVDILNVTKEQFSSLYFATAEYKQNLNKSLKRSKKEIIEGRRLEEEIFLHDALAKLTAVQYELWHGAPEEWRRDI